MKVLPFLLLFSLLVIAATSKKYAAANPATPAAGTIALRAGAVPNTSTAGYRAVSSGSFNKFR